MSEQLVLVAQCFHVWKSDDVSCGDYKWICRKCIHCGEVTIDGLWRVLGYGKLPEVLCANPTCRKQSDEVSVLMNGYRTIDEQPWFDSVLQKMASISASVATAAFNRMWGGKTRKPAQFDSRVFVVPENDVCNYFLWRQQDASRNSIQMLTRFHYSHSEVNGKNTSDMHDMLHQKGVNWNDLSTSLRRGRCIVRKSDEGFVLDNEIPVFSQDRNYIERHLEHE